MIAFHKNQHFMTKSRNALNQFAKAILFQTPSRGVPLPNETISESNGGVGTVGDFDSIHDQRSVRKLTSLDPSS